jgi:type IV pilus assembly protein PilN
MMIRINLLPTRQVQKRAAGRQYLFILGGALIMTLLANGYWWFVRDSEINRRQAKIAETDAAITRLEATIKEVNDLKKRQAEVKEKLGVLDDLKKKRAGPVKVLDAMIQATPKKVWLLDFDEKAGSLKVTGQAESFDDLSEFMRSLKGVVWTPKGMGRVVEAKRDGSSRVEIIGGGAIEDFSGAETSHFFTNIDLKNTTADVGSKTTNGPKLVKFEMTLNVNYAI